MTDFTRDWIAKRRELLDAATEGPWWTTRDMTPADVFAGDGSADDVALATDIEEPADATLIADARTSLPAALAALKAVLELANNPYPHARNISGWDLINTVAAALRGES